MDREAVAHWAQQRFDADISFDDLKNRQRDEIRELLLDISRQHQQRANELIQDVRQRLERVVRQLRSGRNGR